MAAPVFIGDELTAAGFRLAGASVRTPPPEAIESALQAALQEATLIVIGAGAAARLPPSMLERALESTDPVVAVVPDALGDEPPSLAGEIRRRLGIGA